MRENLHWITKELARFLTDSQRLDIEEAITVGDFENAGTCLLRLINWRFLQGKLAFEEAAEFYNLLDLPQKCVYQFPQLRCAARA